MRGLWLSAIVFFVFFQLLTAVLYAVETDELVKILTPVAFASGTFAVATIIIGYVIAPMAYIWHFKVHLLGDKSYNEVKF